MNDGVCADSGHKCTEKQAIGGYRIHRNGFQLWEKLIAETPGVKTLFHRHPLMVTADDRILDEKDSWHDPGEAQYQGRTGQQSPEPKGQ